MKSNSEGENMREEVTDTDINRPNQTLHKNCNLYVWKKRLSHHLNEIADRAETILKGHSEKLDNVNEMLQTVNTNVTQNETLSLEQSQNFDAERQALCDKVKEMELQKREFRFYLRSMLTELEKMINLPRLEKDMLEIRKMFGVECERLKNALPMYARRADIIDVVTNNQVSVILGETGSGKSTQLPQFLYKADLFQNGLIICTQPRKVAAISLATRVAEEMASSVGQLVGYQVGTKIKKNITTKILYVTDHILLNECLKDSLLKKYSCIIIDEAHERSIYTDLLLGMIKKILPRRPDLRTVITSATIDPKIFVNYFHGCPVLKVSGRMFPVEVIWKEDDNDKDSFEKYEDAAVEKALDVHRTETEGGILVFLTSPLEVERCCQSFEDKMKGRTDFMCLQLHGKLQADEQQKVFEKQPEGKRRIVFATNTAETSITIKDVRFVIDTGLVKEIQFDANRKVTSLNVTTVTKSSAEQRKGRAGRTAAGKCYRLYTDDDFDKMRPDNVPEILRIHLGHAILKLMQLGADPLDFDFVQSPTSKAIESAISSLHELGTIKDKEITELGKKVAKLPIDPEYGVLIFEALQRDVGIEALIIAASAKVGSIFYRAGNDEEKQNADRLKVRFCSENGDLMTTLSAFKEWHAKPEKEKGRWCFQNRINGKTIKGLRDTVNEIRTVLKNDLGIDVEFQLPASRENEDTLVELIFRVLKSNISHFLGHSKAGYWIIDNCERVHLHPTSSLLTLGRTPDWIIFQHVMRTTNDFAMVVTPVQEELVEKAVREHWLDIDIGEVKSKRLSPVFISYTGTQLLRDFVGQRFSNLKKKEEQLNDQCKGSITVIDVDKCKGQIMVYSSQEFTNTITVAMNETLNKNRQRFASEEVEEPVSTDAPATRALIGEGGSVKAIFMPEEYRTVTIHCPETDTSHKTEDNVREYFQQFGPIKICKKNRPNSKFPSVWGHVTFHTNDSACEAVAATSNDTNLSARPKEKQSKKALKEFNAKIKWCRRKSKGVGFVQLKNAEHVTLIKSRHDKIIVAGSNAKIMIAKDKPDQLFVSKFSTSVTEDNLRQIVANAFSLHPSTDIGKVNIVREKTSTSVEMLNEMNRQLQSIIEKYTVKDHYKLEIKPPMEFDYQFVAYVSFKDPEEGILTCKAIDQNFVLNDERLTMKADLKSSIYISKSVYDKTSNEIKELVKSIQKVNANMKIVMKQLKNGNTVINFNGESFEDISRAKRDLNNVVKGDVFDFSDKTTAKHVFTRRGRQKLDSIMTSTQTVIIVDNRVKTISVHGIQSDREKATNAIDMYLKELSCGSFKQIDLKGLGKPPGVMKTMMEKFGTDLTSFMDQSKLASIDVDQRNHRLKMFGTDDALREAADIVTNIMKELSSKEADLVKADQPDCVVCFCPIDDGELYRLEVCGHSYCNDCIKGQVEIAVDEGELPLKCSQEDCDTPWVWRDIISLSRKGFVTIANLVSSAVTCFVTQHTDKFRFCITPDCPMVYKVTSDERIFECAICELRICSSCHEQSHDGMSCLSNKNVKDDDDLSLWMKENPDIRKLCPNCKVPIEKNGGCNRMTCVACNKSICWVCLDVFDNSSDCYGHLSRIHSGYY